MKSILSFSATLALSATLAHADAMQTSMINYVNESMRDMIAFDAAHAAIKASNAAHSGLSEAEILALDTLWRSEIGLSSRPTIDPVLRSEVSLRLQGYVAESQGRITEIIMMDNRGMNVAVSDVTSDFWQGDEAKYLETYPKGAEAMHISEVELDESSQTYQAQVSFVLSDPETGNPIGAVTVGLNAEEF
ncbi:MAG: hypothetical protein AB3N11_10305 [Arenibacterium sp.]